MYISDGSRFTVHRENVEVVDIHIIYLIIDVTSGQLTNHRLQMAIKACSILTPK